jgi:hypothetical protein
LKLLQENVGEPLQDEGEGKNFLNRTPIAQEIRARIDKWDSLNLKSFCTAKEAINRVKRLLADGRKSLPSIHQTRN